MDWPFGIVPSMQRSSFCIPQINQSMGVGCLHRGNVTLDKATSLKWRTILQRGTQLWAISGQPSCQLDNESSVPVGNPGGITQHPLLSILCVPFASDKQLILYENSSSQFGLISFPRETYKMKVNGINYSPQHCS